MRSVLTSMEDLPLLHKRSSSLPTIPVEELNAFRSTKSKTSCIESRTSSYNHARSEDTCNSSNSSILTPPATPTNMTRFSQTYSPGSPKSLNTSTTPIGSYEDYHSRYIPSLSSPPSLWYPSMPISLARARKRLNTVRELYETECQFARDMAVIVKFYICTSADIPVESETLGILFSNITEILDISLSLVAILDANIPQKVLKGESCTNALAEMTLDSEVRIGHAMCLYLTGSMYKAYEHYVHFNTQQMDTCFKLARDQTPAINQWLKRCTKQAQDYTTAWSLDSLLIKPVQRLGKYPLFLKSLHDETDTLHGDYDELVTAKKRATHYIECINTRFECRQ